MRPEDDVVLGAATAQRYVHVEAVTLQLQLRVTYCLLRLLVGKLKRRKITRLSRIEILKKLRTSLRTGEEAQDYSLPATEALQPSTRCPQPAAMLPAARGPWPAALRIQLCIQRNPPDRIGYVGYCTAQRRGHVVQRTSRSAAGPTNRARGSQRRKGHSPTGGRDVTL